MKKLMCVLCLTLAVACVSQGVPYQADEIVFLPGTPYPDHTNEARGIVEFGQEPGDYTVMVENELKLENWKEWVIKYTITPLNPESWYFDPHIDYSIMVDPAQPIEDSWFDRIQMTIPGTQTLTTAWWDVGYFGSPSSPSETFVWYAAGFPHNVLGAGQYVSSIISKPDVTIDTWPFDWNPEWVSLEFAGANVLVEYEFVDWCVPEPGSVCLLGLGCLFFRKKRKA